MEEGEEEAVSWWIRLVGEDGECVQVENHAEGGTYCVGGTNEADLNVTYNYGGRFSECGLEVHTGRGNFHRQKAKDVTALLESAVQKLGTECHPDYWEPTPGNAGRALSILLEWAKQHPEATFEVH